MRIQSPVKTIINATVLDTADFTLRPGQTVQISEGLITQVRPGIDADRDEPGLLDAGGRIVMPGLIDAHVHVTAATAGMGEMAYTSPNYIAAQSKRIMEQMLARGFTTVRDVAGADYGLARAVEEGLFRGPRLIFGGKALSQTGGHGDMRGPGESHVDNHRCCPAIGVVCDGETAVRTAARDQLRTGAHHLKIMLSGGVASPTDRVDSIQFSDAEIRAAVEEAEACNRYVTGHAYTARAVNRGLHLGVRCIEHGNLIDDESVELFKKYDAFLVPTLVTYVHLKRDGAATGLPVESQRKVDSVLASGLHALELATKGGVKIAFGTDLLGDMHQYQSEEFEIRAQVQSSEQVLRSASTTAAQLIGAEGKLGVLAPGAHADLLVLNADPVADVRVLSQPEQSIDLVIKAGVLEVDHASIR
ncbi:metal-dependent hydrolase family protein [Glutamicibacter halophytocola]|uniref:Amidohydrolase family protein n=1 Tax=Glutamicibacter halophytocola TaxID=1933880 RepID=A0AA95BSX1_9MICC|nr:amidohydrolase family protein [Glutamicibacter halophytocola]NQD41828.1 amidohydrolase family protein [Glutamicibacter halophytocola]UUX60449.1 amidohydrolase family protein [Glutamicibacter halophytocola]